MGFVLYGVSGSVLLTSRRLLEGQRSAGAAKTDCIEVTREGNLCRRGAETHLPHWEISMWLKTGLRSALNRIKILARIKRRKPLKTKN